MASLPKAVGLTILAVWALAMGAWIWSTYFDSALHPSVTSDAAVATDHAKPSPASTVRPFSYPAAVGLPDTAGSVANRIPMTVQPASSTPAIPPSTPPAVVDPSSKQHPGIPAAPGPADIQHAREEALQSELAADPQAFAARYGLTAERIREAQSENLPLTMILTMQAGKQPAKP